MVISNLKKYFIDYKKEVKNLICFDFENKKKFQKKTKLYSKKSRYTCKIRDYLNKEHDMEFFI